MPNVPNSHDPARMHLVLMLVLTFSTGIIDAVGYLGLDRVFTGNMTGNVVILGMALMGADGLPVLGPSVALVGFVLGAAIAGRVLKKEDAGWSQRTTVLIAVVGLFLVLTALALFADLHQVSAGAALSVTGFIAGAMGLQAATARHLAVKDVTTVVVTSTLTGLAADSPLGGGSGKYWERRLLAVALILLGAAAGAAFLQVHIGVGVLFTGVLAIGVAMAGERSRQQMALARALVEAS
ncbi:YoaK family protein [Glutamicibacter sp. TV12E]|uniref:YoaK family protein n=1 Tax=Glutamicibacter sp. TV12E TaxID=3446362 RepID=UPI00403340AC